MERETVSLSTMRSLLVVSSASALVLVACPFPIGTLSPSTIASIAAHASSRTPPSSASYESVATSLHAPVAPRANAAAIEATLCHGRAECRLHALEDAGDDAGGDAIFVATIWIGSPQYEAAEGDAACPDFELWSAISGTKGATSTRFLVAGGNVCLQWGGFDERVAANELRYVFAGSGAPITVSGLPWTTVLRLSPIEIVRSDAPKKPKIGAADAPILDFTEW